MPALLPSVVDSILQKIKQFRSSLGSSDGDRILDGTLRELTIHFLQRGMIRTWCYDLDFIVIGFDVDSNPIIRAVAEIKNEGRPLKKNQRIVYRTIADALDVPFYLIEADRTQENFWVQDMKTGAKMGPIDIDKFAQWFQNLSIGKILKELKSTD